MVKLAICILVFALFALALSARVPREESNPAQEFLTKAQGDFNEFIEKLKALDAKKVEGLFKDGLNTVQEGLQKLNETFLQAPAAST